MTAVQGYVGSSGPVTTATPGVTIRLGNTGEVVVQELHGRYYETTFRGKQYWASNPTGVTTVAFTSGTTTALLGVSVANPIGSTVNLVINKVGIAFPVIDTTVNTALLAVGYNGSTNVTHTTALTVRSGLVGTGASGFGLADASFTYPTAPNTLVQLASMPSATTLPGISLYDLEGSIILPPGGYACVITSAASPASGFQASIAWEEISTVS